jgi:hypothetical protein
VIQSPTMNSSHSFLSGSSLQHKSSAPILSNQQEPH